MNDNKWGGVREGAGRNPLNEKDRKKGYKIYINYHLHEDIIKYGKGENFSAKAVELINTEINKRK